MIWGTSGKKINARSFSKKRSLSKLLASNGCTTSKYNARKIKIDGYIFDSVAESKEYGELRISEKLGEIKDLKVHPKYPISINDKFVCHVELDFEYYDNKQNRIRYIDVKGFPTDVSKLKKKMIEAAYNIEVEWKKAR